jgi:hypothetical protein
MCSRGGITHASAGAIPFGSRRSGLHSVSDRRLSSGSGSDYFGAIQHQRDQLCYAFIRRLGIIVTQQERWLCDHLTPKPFAGNKHGRGKTCCESNPSQKRLGNARPAQVKLISLYTGDDQLWGLWGREDFHNYRIHYPPMNAQVQLPPMYALPLAPGARSKTLSA